MELRDRFTQGFLAGLVAGIIMNILDYISHLLGITELTFIDWGGAIIFGYRPGTVSEHILALSAQLFFASILGVFFVYLIPAIKSKNILFKAWAFGLASWFSIYGLSLLLNLKDLMPIRSDTAMSDVVNASIYGIILGYIVRYLNHRIKT